MEVVVFAIITAVWWMLSFTCLLPFTLLLIFFPRIQNWFFAFLCTHILKPIFGPALLPMRRKAFDLLNSELKKDSHVKSPLKILEIGIGEGANLELYPENVELTALDMNESFKLYLANAQKKHPHIQIQKLITNFAEDMKDVKDAEFDVVISTYVMCSVKSIPDAMKEIYRVLKPGGKFLFLEHVGYPSQKSALAVQLFTNPLWKIYFGGCNLHRSMVKDISPVFSHVTYEHLFAQIMFYVRPQLCGIATK